MVGDRREVNFVYQRSGRTMDPPVERLDPTWLAILREKTPAERIAMALDANRTARLRIAGQLQTDHPDWTPEQVTAEIARRMLRGSG